VDDAGQMRYRRGAQSDEAEPLALEFPVSGDQIKAALTEWLKPGWLVAMAVGTLGVWQGSLGRHEAKQANDSAEVAQDAAVVVSSELWATQDSLRIAFRRIDRLQGQLLKLQSGGRQDRDRARARPGSGPRRSSPPTFAERAWNGFTSLFSGRRSHG